LLNKKTYRDLKKKIIIKECGEKLLELSDDFARFNPHQYMLLNAPYGNKSPFFIREDVLKRLKIAQKKLNSLKAGYRLKIFDAYRPLEVQKFMIDYDTKRFSKEIAQKFWSPICDDVKLNPPPHSTGAALDLTIVDEADMELDMGTKIDEFVKESHADAIENDNRKLLVLVMNFADFVQLPTEWWHFSYGDQIWAVDKLENNFNIEAKYGIYTDV